MNTLLGQSYATGRQEDIDSEGIDSIAEVCPFVVGK